MKPITNKYLYYFLSFTWGLPMTIIGLFASLGLILIGKKPKKFGNTWYFNAGKNWGGVTLGMIFIVDEKDRLSTNKHEYGHTIQNCYLGLFMIFLVCIPSAIRYWYFEFKYYRRNKKPDHNYDDIWFEGSATKIGTETYERLISNETLARKSTPET